MHPYPHFSLGRWTETWATGSEPAVHPPPQFTSRVIDVSMTPRRRLRDVLEVPDETAVQCFMSTRPTAISSTEDQKTWCQKATTCIATVSFIRCSLRSETGRIDGLSRYRHSVHPLLHCCDGCGIFYSVSSDDTSSQRWFILALRSQCRHRID